MREFLGVMAGQLDIYAGTETTLEGMDQLVRYTTHKLKA